VWVQLFDDLSHPSSHTPQEYRPSRYSTATADSADHGDGTMNEAIEEDEVSFRGSTPPPPLLMLDPRSISASGRSIFFSFCSCLLLLLFLLLLLPLPLLLLCC